MAIYAESNGTEYEKLKQGNHAGVCIMMVELGTCEEDYQGEKKKQKKVWVRWELPLERRPEDGKPYFIGKEYTLSLSPKASLRKDIDSWGTKPLTEEQAKKFDITYLVGKKCMVSVIPNKNGYPTMDKVTSVPKGYVIPEAESSITVLSYDKWSDEIFNSLPEFIRNKMVKTPEYAKLKGLNASPQPEPEPIAEEEGTGLPF